MKSKTKQDKLIEILYCFTLIDAYCNSVLDSSGNVPDSWKNIKEGGKFFAKGPNALFEEKQKSNFDFTKIEKSLPVISVGGARLIDEVEVALTEQIGPCLRRLNHILYSLQNRSLQQTFLYSFNKWICNTENLTLANITYRVLFPSSLFFYIYLSILHKQDLEVDQLLQFYDFYHENYNLFNPFPWYLSFVNTDRDQGTLFNQNFVDTFDKSVIKNYGNYLNMSPEELQESIDSAFHEKNYLYNSFVWTAVLYFPFMFLVNRCLRIAEFSIHPVISNIITSSRNINILYLFLKRVDIFSHYFNINTRLYYELQSLERDYDKSFPLRYPNSNDPQFKHLRWTQVIPQALHNRDMSELIVSDLINRISQLHNSWNNVLILQYQGVNNNQLLRLPAQGLQQIFRAHFGVGWDDILNHLYNSPRLQDEYVRDSSRSGGKKKKTKKRKLKKLKTKKNVKV